MVFNRVYCFKKLGNEYDYSYFLQKYFTKFLHLYFVSLTLSSVF